METKRWYESKAVWGGLLAIGASVAGMFGVEVDAAAQDQLADYIVVIVGAVGGVIAIYGRLKAEKKIK